MLHTLYLLAVGDAAESAAPLWYGENELRFVNSNFCQEHDVPHKLRLGLWEHHITNATVLCQHLTMMDHLPCGY